MALKQVGIRDVAREAGVSVTTVSHILNRVEFARASDETRERVFQTAARLGYGPNRMARGLRLQRSEMIGLLSEDIATTPHASRIILGAQDAARAQGLTLMLINTTRQQGDLERDINTLLRQQVDGVLYATMYHRELQVSKALMATPTVLIDSTDKSASIAAVVPDEKSGAMNAMNELISYGHRRIGFITNIDDVPATTGRYDGYATSLAAAEIAIDETLVISRISETPGGYEAARFLLDRPDRPTALFCYNDRMAMGAYRAAAELGIRIPSDLSIVGFDNQEILAEGLFPSLTTVALPHYEMGEWALNELVATISGDRDARIGPIRPMVLPCPLVRRESVARPRG